MKVVGNRTIITLAIAALVAIAQAQGYIDLEQAAKLKEFLLYLAGIFFATKVQALVEK